MKSNDRKKGKSHKMNFTPVIVKIDRSRTAARGPGFLTRLLSGMNPNQSARQHQHSQSRQKRTRSTVPLSQWQGMRTRTRTVKNTKDRVQYIAKSIQGKQGKQSRLVHGFAALALTDFCGDRWCVEPRNWEAEANEVLGFVRDNIRYTLDTYGIDTYRTPERTIQAAFGDCDDMTALIGGMMQAVGFPVRIKVIRLRGFDDFHHIYPLVGIPPHAPSQWLAMDATQPHALGWEPDGIVEDKIYEIK